MVYPSSCFFFFFKQKTAYEIMPSLVGSEMCIRDRVNDVEWIVTNTEKEALILESNLIKLHKPRYNVRLTDDGSFPYIRITSDVYPSITVTRAVRKDGSSYFGPYTSAQATRQSVKVLRKAFPLRSCTRDLQRVLRPCLNYQLKLCAGPCAGKTDPYAYSQLVTGVRRFLDCLLYTSDAADDLLCVDLGG